MATNRMTFVKNLISGSTEPLVMLGSFQSGATQAIKRGELLELTADTNTEWVPMDSDYAMAADVAVANEEIKSGDLAGFYEIIVPRPGDVFRYELDAADDLAIGTALYWTSSEKVTDTAGTNIIGHVAGQKHYPKQNHKSEGAGGDAGITLKNQSYVEMTFRNAVSYLRAFQKEA